MVRPSLLALAAQMMVLSWPALAQSPEAAPQPLTPAAQEAAPSDPAMTGGTARAAPSRSARPPSGVFRPPRQPRPYKVCLQRARERGLRGGDRRSFITRCQLGYGGGGPSTPVRR